MVVEALSGVVSQGDGGGVRVEEGGESLGGGGEARGDRNPRSPERFQPNLRRFLNVSFTSEISPRIFFSGDALCCS